MPLRKTNPFKLRAFRGFDSNVITILAAIQVKTTSQMLLAGQTTKKKVCPGEQGGVSEADVPELVRLSGLACLPGVKGIRVRQYTAAGVDPVAKLATYEPDQLFTLTSEFVERTGFESIVPLLKEVSSTTEIARMIT